MEDQSVKLNGRRDGRSGTVAVELALMLPFLIILFVSVADLGLLIREHQILENAAREGARYSALSKNWLDPVRNPTASRADIENHIIDYCREAGITVDPSNITIDQGHTITAGGRSVSASLVTVTTQRTPLTPLAEGLTGGAVQLTGEAVFRNFHAGT